MSRPKYKRPQVNSLFQDSNKTRLNVMFWNAGGLTKDKFSEFKKLVFSNDIDIYGIVEAGASSDNINFLQLQGYQTYVLPRARQVASGIIVAAKTSVTVSFKIVKEHTETDKLEGIELNTWKEGAHKRFLVVYNPPRNKPDLVWLEQRWGKGCIFYGDLNAPSTLWGYANSDAVGKIFEDFIASNPVEYIENETNSTTFLSYAGYTSHPDIVFAHPSESSNVTISLLPPPGGFGHKILVLNILYHICRTKEARKPRWNTKKANWVRYSKLTDELLTSHALSENTDMSVKNVSDIILRCALKAVPRGQVKRYAPFWNKKLDFLKKERDKARTRAEITNTQENRIALKRCSAKFKREIISAKQNSYRNFLEKLDFRKDGVKAHRFLSQLKNQNYDKNNPIRKGTNILTSEMDIAKHFCKHYSKISNYCPNKSNEKPDLTLPATCEKEENLALLDKQIQLAELELALSHMKKGKSAGPDDLLPEFLIHLGSKAKIVLLLLFRQIWESYIPSQWRKAEVVPILKKGKNSDSPENYRPIALTSVFSKLYERVVARRIEVFLEKNKLMSDRQAGFKKRRNTTEQVARLAQDIKDGYHRKQSTLAVFIDFKTAFDRVWRKKLLSKLISYGITGKLYKTVFSFLAQRFIRVRYKNATSAFKQTRQGLPQGSVLSPLLFNIMIDDVTKSVESIPGVSCLLYADDLVFWATSSDVKALELCLNQVLIKLKDWADSNEMLVNPSKSEFQLFTLSTKNHDINLIYGGDGLSRTEEASYLGIRLDTKLSWNKQIENQVEKASKRMGLIKRLTGTKWGASQDVLILAYKAYVRPVIDYGSEVTITASQSSLKKLDIIQNQALRLITGGPKSTPLAALEMQAKVEPLHLRRECLALSMYERIRRLNIPYWKNCKPATERLKTQITFVSEAEQIAKRRGLADLQRLDIPTIADQNPMATAICCLELIKPVSKGNTLLEELKAITLETCAKRYPEEEWLRVYTDGSAEGARRKAGAGVYCQYFHFSAPVGLRASNYEGELKAVELALEKLQNRMDDKVVLMIDSQAAITSIGSHAFSDSRTVLRCRHLVERLINRGTTVVLQWIPGHCGVFGNEEADRLAREGSQMDQPDLPQSLHDAKREIKTTLRDQMRKDHYDKAEGKQWETLREPNGLIPSGLPRDQLVACFRLKTGHDYLGKHLCRIGVNLLPSCMLCETGEDMTASHLDSCPALEDIRTSVINKDSFFRKSELYWAARRRMAETANVLA